MSWTNAIPTAEVSAAKLGLPRTGAYGYLVAVVLGVVFAFNFMDRQLLSILAEPIRRELALTDTQMGALTGLAFSLFYTTFGIPIAWLADRTHRVRIVAAACAAWSAFSALTGFAHGFVFLALMRVGVGVGEAGGSPPSYSLIADYFPAHRRGLGLAIYALGVPIGAMVGTVAGAGIASRYGWRAAFFAVGVSGLVVALVTLALVREPIRGRSDGPDVKLIGAGRRGSLLGAIADFYANRTLRLTAVSSALSAFVSFGVINWAPAFLIRERHMTLGQIAIYYGVISGVAGIVGTFGSGWLVDRFGRRNRDAYALIPMAAFIVAAPMFVGFLVSRSWPVAISFLAAPALLLNMWLTPALTVVQNGSKLHQRSTSGAILSFVLNLVGLGGGPLFVGAISDWAAPRFGGASLQIGLGSLLPFFIFAILAHHAAARSINRDSIRELPHHG